MSVKEKLQEHIDEIIELKKQGTYDKDIAETYDVSVTTLSKVLKENGYWSRPKFTKEDELSAIDDYINKKMPVTKIAAKYHKEPKFISNLLTSNGIKLEGSTIRNRKYKINQDFFEKIDTPEKAYCLGLIVADGWVHRNRLSLSLQEGDKQILQDVLRAMDSEHPLYYIDYQSKDYNCFGGYHRQNQWRFSISNAKICKDLEKYGVIQNKSLKTTYPDGVPDELFPHFLRGYFDGDGSIAKVAYGFQLTGCEEFLKVIQEKIKNILGVETRIVNAPCNNGITKNLIYTKKDGCKLIYDFMYQDATIYLQRKYDKYEDKFYLTA